MSINNVNGIRSDISEIISKIRDVSSKSSVLNTHSVATPKSFDDVLSVAKNALTHVNQVQMESEKINNAFVAGDSDVSMSQVILASKKSLLAFEGLVTVRNKILEAYREIMNMPI